MHRVKKKKGCFLSGGLSRSAFIPLFTSLFIRFHLHHSTLAHLSCSLGESREGSREKDAARKKKRRRAIYHRRAMAVNPMLFLSPFSFQALEMFDFTRHFSDRVSSIYTKLSVEMTFRRRSFSFFLFFFYLNKCKYPDFLVEYHRSI